MPRPPKNQHPLRAIRAATAFQSQTEFARIIGVSMATIQAIENGKLRLTPKLAARIRDVTGASDRELLKGAAGKPRTVGGQPYTEAYFSDWTARQKSRLQQESRDRDDWHQLGFWMQLLLDAARTQGSVATLQQARTLIAESLDQIGTKIGLTNRINDFLTPYQGVETRCATGTSWKKDPAFPGSARGILPAPVIPAKTRLTVSIQTSPCWTPHLPPPRPARGNLELIPTSFFVIAIGKAGCGMADAWWKALCREHGIDSGDGTAVHASPTGNWQGFFRRVRQESGPDKYVPRGAFLDLEAGDLAALAQGSGALYHPGGILAGKQNSGNIFAGPGHPDAGRLLDGAVQFLRRQADDTAGLGGIFLLHSLEGGTGSGLSSQLLCLLRREMPVVPLVSIAPLSQTDGNHAAGADYNATLATAALIQHCSAALLFQNQELLKELHSAWRIPHPTLDDANSLLSEMLCALTAPLRYPSNEAPPWQLADLIAAMNHADPAGPALFSLRGLPLPAIVKRAKAYATAGDLVAGGIALLPKAERKCTEALSLFIRARSAETHVQNPKAKSREFRLTQERRIGSHESVVLVKPDRFLPQWTALHQRTQQLFQRKAYLHWYEHVGITCAALAEAIHFLEGQSKGEFPLHPEHQQVQS